MSMETLFTILTILAGLAVIGPVLARLVVAYQQAVGEITSLELLARHAQEEARSAIEQAAAVEAEIPALQAQVEELHAQLRPLEDALSAENMARREQVYMPVDRYSEWDEEYLVRIVNRTFDMNTFHAQSVESWARGRQHVFWASGDGQLMGAVEARFPSALGYDVVATNVSPYHLAGSGEAPAVPMPAMAPAEQADGV
jgi:hypothetical protein